MVQIQIHLPQFGECRPHKSACGGAATSANRVRPSVLMPLASGRSTATEEEDDLLVLASIMFVFEGM